MKKYASLELFAGTGGLGLGLSNAYFHPEAVIEWNRECCDTIRFNQNRGLLPVADWALLEADVRDIDFSQFGRNMDLVSGGPPCQPFSLGGKHSGRSDKRDMFPQAIRAVRQLMPKAFVFENVKGLTREVFSNYLEYIRLQLTYPELAEAEGEAWTDHLTRLEKYHTSGKPDGLYYRVVVRVLNAADYGVPQRRERVFIVGFRSDLNTEWSFPKPTHSKEALARSKYGTGEYWKRHGIRIPPVEDAIRRIKKVVPDKKPGLDLQPWTTVRDTICDLPDPEKPAHVSENIHNHKFQPGARQYPGHTGSPLDEPAKTLKAGDHGVPGGENMLLRPDGSVRYFTIRESARLQTFPDEFAFCGSWTETMRQLGNAVPVKLAETVAGSIRDCLTAATK